MFSSQTCFGTEFRVVFFYAEWFRMEFRAFASNFVPWYRIPSIFFPLRNGSEQNSKNFLFRGTAGILPEQSNCSVYSVFRWINFMSEIANPMWHCPFKWACTLLEKIAFEFPFQHGISWTYVNFAYTFLCTLAMKSLCKCKTNCFANKFWYLINWFAVCPLFV